MPAFVIFPHEPMQYVLFFDWIPLETGAFRFQGYLKNNLLVSSTSVHKTQSHRKNLSRQNQEVRFSFSLTPDSFLK